MSMFYCAECDLLSDADDGCEEDASGLRLICVDCAADREDADASDFTRSDQSKVDFRPGLHPFPPHNHLSQGEEEGAIPGQDLPSVDRTSPACRQVRGRA
jgi:hypothetical protein